MSFWHVYADAHIKKMRTPKQGTHGIVAENTSVDSLQSLWECRATWLPQIEKSQLKPTPTRVIQFGHFAGCPQRLRGVKSDTLLFFNDPRSTKKVRHILLQLIYGNPADVMADPCFESVSVPKAWIKNCPDSIFSTKVSEADQGRLDTIVDKKGFDALQTPSYSGPKKTLMCLPANKFGLWKRPSSCPQIWSLHIAFEASEMPKEKRCFVPHTKEWITDTSSGFFSQKNSAFWEYFDDNPHGQCCYDIYNVRKESSNKAIELAPHLVNFLDEGICSPCLRKESDSDVEMASMNEKEDPIEAPETLFVKEPETVSEPAPAVPEMPKIKKQRVEGLLEKFALSDIQKQTAIKQKFPIFQKIPFATRLDLFNSAQVMIIEKVHKEDVKS